MKKTILFTVAVLMLLLIFAPTGQDIPNGVEPGTTPTTETSQEATLVDEDLTTTGRVEVPPIVASDSRGSLVIDFVDEDNEPVEGIRGIVFPPRELRIGGSTFKNSLGETEAVEWRQLSDSEGIARWDNLPPGSGFRWATFRNVVYDPPSEHNTCSGSFEILGSQVVVFTSLVPSRTVLIGQLNASPSKKRPHVRLYKSSITDEGWTENREEPRGGVYAEPDGRFIFKGITPGQGFLNAIWEGENSYYIAGLQVEIVEGLNNVGVLPVETTGPYVVDVQFHLGGQPTSPGDLFEDGFEEYVEAGKMKGVLSVDFIEEVECSDKDRDFSTMAWMDLSKPFSFHGLYPGRWRVAIEPELRFPQFRPGYQLLGTWPEVFFDVAEQGSQDIQLVFQVKAMTQVEFSILWDGEPFRAKVFLVSDSGHFHSFRLKSDETATENIPSGRYQLLLTPHYSMSEVNLCASQVVDITANGQQVIITAREGATVTGTSSGRVRLTFPPWSDCNPCVFPYTASPDEDGRFSIQGVVPYATLSGHSQTFEVQGPGSENRFTVN